MNKFLIILLIAIVATTTVPAFDDLEGFWGDFWEKVKEFIKKLPGYLKKVYQWLKDNGYWDQLVELVKKYGIPKGIEICTQYLKKEDLCTDLINFVFSFLK